MTRPVLHSRGPARQPARHLTSRVTSGLVALVALVISAGAAAAQNLLVPMDDAQQNHLKAYGLTFNALKAGNRAEWFINYRGGAFLLPDGQELR